MVRSDMGVISGPQLAGAAVIGCTVWLLEFMRHRSCLLKVSLSPSLVECSKMLTDNFQSIFEQDDASSAYQEKARIRACQSVLLTHCGLTFRSSVMS